MIMRFLRQRNPAVYDADTGSKTRTLPPIAHKYPLAHGGPTEFISIPSMDIPALAEKYIAAMETEASADWCRCEWVIHPDDTEVKAGTCRECGERKGSDAHNKIDEIDPDRHHFKGKRMRRGDEASDCPVHTRAGLVIYFFEWVFINADK